MNGQIAKWAVNGAAIALTLAFSGRASAAAPGLWLEVTRAADARACPDSANLTATVEALFDASVVRLAARAKDASLSVVVSIAKSDEGYAATLRVENERWSERRIVDRDPACRGLPEAVAVAVVLLVEPRAEPQRRRASSQPNVYATDPRVTRARTIRLSAEAGGLLGTGLLGDLGSLTYGGFLGGIVSHGGPGFQLRGVRLLRPDKQFAEGSLEFDGWAALFGPCWRLALTSGWALRPCVDVGLGLQHGRARSFPVNGSDSAPWRVLAGEATLIFPVGSIFQGVLWAGGALRLHRQTYLIDDSTAESQPGFAPFMGAGLSLPWQIGGDG